MIGVREEGGREGWRAERERDKGVHHYRWEEIPECIRDDAVGGRSIQVGLFRLVEPRAADVVRVYEQNVDAVLFRLVRRGGGILGDERLGGRVHGQHGGGVGARGRTDVNDGPLAAVLLFFLRLHDGEERALHAAGAFAVDANHVSFQCDWHLITIERSFVAHAHVIDE